MSVSQSAADFWPYFFMRSRMFTNLSVLRSRLFLYRIQILIQSCEYFYNASLRSAVMCLWELLPVLPHYLQFSCAGKCKEYFPRRQLLVCLQYINRL
jgi:hypothetical protein